MPISFEFIKVKSYENDQSTANITISGLSEKELQGFRGMFLCFHFIGKDILIVEDIVDTGRTMKALLEKLKGYEPASVRVVSLLVKKREGKAISKYQPEYVGFTIPDHFVVGYALDYNEMFRDLDHICVINEAGKRRYAQ